MVRFLSFQFLFYGGRFRLPLSGPLQQIDTDLRYTRKLADKALV